jgi:hypothetical protein
MRSLFKVENICGKNIGENILENIQNNPNFVFENDPNYETVVLYNSEGTVINVNSWIECANYVEGGWTNSLISNSNSELYYFLFLIGFTFSLFIYKLIQKKYA